MTLYSSITFGELNVITNDRNDIKFVWLRHNVIYRIVLSFLIPICYIITDTTGHELKARTIYTTTLHSSEPLSVSVVLDVRWAQCWTPEVL